MNWQELNEARNQWGLTIEQMAKFIGVTPAAYKRWKTQPNGVPIVVSNAMEGYLLLSKRARRRMMRQRSNGT